MLRHSTLFVVTHIVRRGLPALVLLYCAPALAQSGWDGKPRAQPAATDQASTADSSQASAAGVAQNTESQPGLDSESQATLSAIGRRFGHQTPQLTAMSIIIDMIGPDADMSQLKQSVAEVSRALEKSNCGVDLSAPPVPTGDALYDRYAVEVDKRINALTTDDTKKLATVAALPDELLATWEPDFGGDARYWELRYACALLGGEGRTYAPGFAMPADYLREAQKRGCASANTLLLLYGELVKKHDKLLEPLTTYEPGVNPFYRADLSAKPFELPARPTIPEETMRKAAALNAQCEVEELALLDAAVAAGPDQAWAYYTRAMYWFTLGEYDKGVADMQAGNAAPVNVYPRPFPIPQVVDSLTAPAALGSAAVCGAVLLMHLEFPRPDYMRIRDLANEATAAASLIGDARVLDTWHRFACRLPGSRSEDVIATLMTHQITGYIYRYCIEDQKPVLSTENLDTLERELRLREQLNEHVKNDVIHPDTFGWTLSLGIAGGIRGLPVYIYLLSEIESSFTQQTAKPLLADLAQVRFPDLVLPEALRKYKPMSELEYQVGHRGHRVGNWCRTGARHSRGDYGIENMFKALDKADQAQPPAP